MHTDKQSPPLIIIAGSGRSGTTWVLDVLAEANNLRTIFEPLNPAGLKEAIHFAYRYIREESEEPELKLFFDKIFSGNIHSLWADYRYPLGQLPLSFSYLTSLKALSLMYVRLLRLVTYYRTYRRKRKRKRLIVKFIRANLMLGWLQRTYNARIVYLVRHPGAVVESQIRTWGKLDRFDKILHTYIQSKMLQKDFLRNFLPLLSKKMQPIILHTIVWCIENSIPLRQTSKNRYCKVFYENLVTHSHSEFNRIINWTGLDTLPDCHFLTKPSQQVSPQKKNSKFDENMLSDWSMNFTQDQLKLMEEILERFGITDYSMYNPMPKDTII